MLLHDGRVLLAGGGIGGGNAFSSAELFNPSTGSWTSGGTMGVARQNVALVLLGGGQVLAAAGFNGTTELASAGLCSSS